MPLFVTNLENRFSFVKAQIWFINMVETQRVTILKDSLLFWAKKHIHTFIKITICAFSRQSSAASETCLTTDTCLTAESCSHTIVEIDHEIISTAILPLLLIQGGVFSVTNESMCMKYWLTAKSIMPRKKVWLGELTVPT